MGQPDHPEVKSAISLIKRKCREAGLPYGIFGTSPEALTKEIEDGCTYLLCGVDSMVLTDSYREMINRLRK